MTLTMIFILWILDYMQHICIPFSKFEFVMVILTFKIIKSLFPNLLDKNVFAYLSCVSTGKGRYPSAFSFLAMIFPLFKIVSIVRSFIAKSALNYGLNFRAQKCSHRFCSQWELLKWYIGPTRFLIIHLNSHNYQVPKKDELFD